ncbi:MAG TPA: GIY-YIG nuclease family protein [Saprospiraceae bacterium]|nr:GIY-YIG nuclease family protein [Saprospiraceae bacterium]HNT21495.1 GIY-YIG nuclease family protein [Saprospiraceae bacterium]
MHYAYILRSELSGKYYYGSSGDIQKRLADHNKGRVKYTKPFRPWKLHYWEEFQTNSEALRRENFFKTIDGYRWLKSMNIT